MDEHLARSAQRFLRLATRLRRLGNQPAAISENLVSPAHLAVLEYIAGQPGCGVQEIADGLRLSPPTVSVTVRHLERSGWLQRQPHPRDRRAVQLQLTPAGEQVYAQAQAAHRRKFEHLLQGLQPEERDVLLSLLERAILTAEQKEPIKQGEQKQ